MRNFRPQVWRDLNVGPRRSVRRALAPRAPAKQQTPRRVGVSTPCVAVSTRCICVFDPGLSEVYKYRRISDPGIRNYYPRLRRDLGACPGKTLDARGLRGLQPIIHHPVALGFQHLRGGIDPGDLRFRSRVFIVVVIWNDFRCGDRRLSSRVLRDLGIGPGGNSRRALAPWAQSNQRSLSGVGVSTPCGTNIDLEVLRFPPRVVPVIKIP